MAKRAPGPPVEVLKELENLKTAMASYGIAGVLFFIALINLGTVGSSRSFEVLVFGLGASGVLAFFSTLYISAALKLAKMRKGAIATEVFSVSFLIFISVLIGIFTVAIISPTAHGLNVDAILGGLIVDGAAAVVSGVVMLYGVYSLCKSLEVKVVMAVVSLAIPILSVIACVLIYRKAAKRHEELA
jgi:hypothetical protein